MAKIRILVPTNFTPQADIAYGQALDFARIARADLYVLHVISNLKAMSSGGGIEGVQNKMDRLIDLSENNTKRKVINRIEHGKVIPQILMTINEVNPDYVFIGTDVKSKASSSSTLKILNVATCPLVIFTGRKIKPGCKKIVLPLDLTKQTKQKIDKTIEIAKMYNSEVHIISATNFLDENICSKIKNHMNQIKAIFDNLEIKCRTELLKTKNDNEIMANAINDYADDIDACLIVIMTRQENKLQKMIVGSMAIKLISKATVPIMCINPNYKQLN